MRDDIAQLRTRLRLIAWVGLGFIALTAIGRLVTPWHDICNGLLLGEAGGAGVVYSMIRQGHLRDGVKGAGLMVSGVVGYFTRMVLLIAVIIVAVKVPHVNVIAALVGYLLGFVFIVVGLYKSPAGRPADEV